MDGAIDKVLLAERMFIIGRELPETAYSAAVLLDMADRHMVRMDGPRLGPINAPESHPVLTQARLIITSADRFRTVDHWVHWIPAAMRQDDGDPIADRLGRAVRRTGVAATEGNELRALLVTDAEPDSPRALLVTLLHASRSIGALFDDDAGERSTATRRAAQIAGTTKAAASAAAATQPVAAVRAAVFAALTPVFTTPSL